MATLILIPTGLCDDDDTYSDLDISTFAMTTLILISTGLCDGDTYYSDLELCDDDTYSADLDLCDGDTYSDLDLCDGRYTNILISIFFSTSAMESRPL